MAEEPYILRIISYPNYPILVKTPFTHGTGHRNCYIGVF